MPPPEIPQDTQKIPWLPKANLKWPGLDIATALVVIIIAIHWMVERSGGPEYVADLFIQLGLTWSGVQSGKIWQVISYALLHGNWFHLLANVLMIWLVGGRVIHILGYRGWMKIIFFGVLSGGVLHLLTSFFLTHHGFQEFRLVGISGACYALLLALTTLSPESKMWPVPISGKNLGLGLILCELFLWLIQPELKVPVLSALGKQMVDHGAAGIFQISHACHFGGAVAGWMIARRLLTPAPSLEQLQKMRAKREAEMGADDIG